MPWARMSARLRGYGLGAAECQPPPGRRAGRGSGIHGRCPPATPTPQCHPIAETRARTGTRREARGAGCRGRASACLQAVGKRRRWRPRAAWRPCGLQSRPSSYALHSQWAGAPSGSRRTECSDPQLPAPCLRDRSAPSPVVGRRSGWASFTVASPSFVFSSHGRRSVPCPRRLRLHRSPA